MALVKLGPCEDSRPTYYGDDKSDLVISIVAFFHSIKLWALATQAF